MDALYKRWYSRPDVEEQVMAFVPSLKYQGLIREASLLIAPKGDYKQTSAVRSSVMYKYRNFLTIAENFDKMSFLASLEIFNYKNDKGETYPFSNFNALFKDDVFYKQNLRGWDFVVDFDGVDFHSKEDMDEIKRAYEAMRGVFGRVYLKYTGGRGFHLYTPWRAFASSDIVDKYPELPKNMALKLKQIVKLKKIDTKIYTPRRILRLPLSIHEGHDAISYPLSINDLDNFEPENYTLEKLIEKKTLNTWDLKNVSVSPFANQFVRGCLNGTKKETADATNPTGSS